LETFTLRVVDAAANPEEAGDRAHVYSIEEWKHIVNSNFTLDG